MNFDDECDVSRCHEAFEEVDVMEWLCTVAFARDVKECFLQLPFAIIRDPTFFDNF